MTVAVEQFVESVTTALDECGADQDTIESVETHGSRMVEHVEQLESDNEQLSERVEQLESETERLSGLVDSTRREQAEIRSDVHDVKQTVESHDDGEIEPAGGGSSPSESKGKTTEDGEDGTTQMAPSPQTGLEEILRLPETVATDSLTANEQRARSVARDVSEYAEYNREYGNYSLSSKRLRIILKSQSEDNTVPHHQTCKRVRSFLSRLGESEVTITEDRGGTNRVVFSESIVERIDEQANHSVVQTDGTEVGVGA